MPAARWLYAGALALQLFALALPAIEGAGFPTQSGLDVLRQGAGAWRDGIVAWYANPLLWAAVAVGWLGAGRRGPETAALVFALLGLGLALSSFTAAAAAASAGRRVPEFHFAIGFHVWLLAFVVAVLAAALALYRGVGRSAAGNGPEGRPARD